VGTVLKNLFNEVAIGQRIEKILKHAKMDVEGMDQEEVLTCDIDATVAALMAPYRLKGFPRLDEGGITMEMTPPLRLDPPLIYVTKFFVPFTGEREIFRTIPVRPPVARNPPKGDLEGDHICVTFVEREPTSERIKGDFHRNVIVIKQYLQQLEAEWNEQFDRAAVAVRAFLLQRRQQLERAGRIARDLGYPLRKRGDAGGVEVPLARKRVEPVVPRNAPKPVLMEPYLADAAYDEIVDTLASMSLVIERNPATFSKLEEPMIRDLFLLLLNGQFEGRAGGETFNGAGKTDILLREGDKNLFIAECKFWDGPKTLTDAIDQLFTYLTWRDSKAAVLVFSRRRDFTRTVEDARKTLEAHSQYRQGRVSARETSFRGWMARPDDEQRRIDLTVMLFHIAPAAPSSSGGKMTRA